jgi:hypothetical protein
MWDLFLVHLHTDRTLINKVRFLKWNIPRGFLHLQNFDRANSLSPLGVQISVPKDFHIHTPPELVGSQHKASSPVQLSAALVSIGVMERASMFLQGRHNELVKSMSRIEARFVSKRVRFSILWELIPALPVLCRFSCINFGSSALPQQKIGGGDRGHTMRITWGF